MDESGPSREDLLKLRRFVERARQAGSAVPLPQLVTLAHELGLSAGVTIDFAASETLGAPMVVVRPAPGSTPGSTRGPAGQATEPTEDPLAVLSPRELEVAALLAEGLRNKEIARRLSISLATVKDHVHHILDKTGLPGRAAVGIAYIARA
ncbi:MAG: helix-turn-helix transcriptional regulator [Myxococcota bacterium]